MTCKNCNAALDGKYCSSCGQSAQVKEITMKQIFHDMIHAFTHADKGFLLLIRKLTANPGTIAREYIEGKRKKYFNPFTFFVITTTLHAYITYQSGYFSAPVQQPPSGGSDMGAQIQAEMTRLVTENLKFVDALLIVPLAAFFSGLYFRNPRSNFAERLVLHAFAFGQMGVIRVLIFVPLFLLFPQYQPINIMIFQLLMLVYLAVAYKQFFMQRTFPTVLKSFLVEISFIVSFWILIFLFVYLKIWVIR